MTKADLDRIPWKDLTHAYGSAADVPELLWELRTSTAFDEGSPLWELFGNIWHQGTVYEATAYAVPFLIELVSNPRTPNRTGILSLLAEIAQGSSYCDSHKPDEPSIEVKRQQELSWVRQAHNAVDAGFDSYLQLTQEKDDLKYAAANVLSRLPNRKVVVAGILQSMFKEASSLKYRCGLLVLLGLTGDVSHETLKFLVNVIDRSPTIESLFAGCAMAILNVAPLPANACAMVRDAILIDDLETYLSDLPWDILNELDVELLFAALDEQHREQVTTSLLSTLESGKISQETVEKLIILVFPTEKNGLPTRVTIENMSAIQRRTIRALYPVVKKGILTGKRVFYGHFPSWGLPDTMQEWRELANGRNPAPVDKRIPLLADAHHPNVPVEPMKLKCSQKVIHRYFGHGTVLRASTDDNKTSLTIRFDEEGVKDLSLSSDDR